MALTPKQERFVAEYLVDLNATQAAVRAGYSAKTAEQQGYQLLQKTSVAEAIAAAQSKHLETVDVSAQRILRELAALGFSDIRGVFDEHGNLKPIHELPDSVAPVIASVEVTKERTRKDGEVTTEEFVTKVKAWDKVRALEMLAKHVGLLKDQVQHSGKLEIEWQDSPSE
jgi:phage terminase small subunit